MRRVEPEKGPYPDSVNRLVDAFATLPGIGRRTAQRLAFWVLKASKDEAGALAEAITRVKSSVHHCPICWNIADQSPCRICADASRDASVIMVVEQPKDLVNLEQTGMFRGIYHVLMGRLDPLDGVGPDSITAGDLLARVSDPSRNARGTAVSEVVLALNPDMEGDTTGLYIAELLSSTKIQVTRLARGLPSGSQIEFANRAALSDAIALRQPI
ncbi:MAG: recombination protein RecR [Phycisphaerales bacterium]|nr:recombination protein RecR [Phycisphaerales bacterium]